jgi:1-acyl-sn-glycerol-3-phosphate acyltransferase
MKGCSKGQSRQDMGGLIGGFATTVITAILLAPHFIRYLFFVFFMKPFLFVFIGMNVRHRERLPSNGPLIVTANHNSHLDAWVLMNLFSQSRLWRIRPVAAPDDFMKNRFTAWISLKCIGIVPISRTPSLAGCDPLQACCRELEEGQILVFPREHEVSRSRRHPSDSEWPISRVAFPRFLCVSARNGKSLA